MRNTIGIALLLVVSTAFAGCLGPEFEEVEDPDATAPECPDGQPCVCIDIDGSCSDGDDDWGYYNLGQLVYYCSGDSPDYAESMGGEYCPNENNPKNPTPVCPNGEFCVCMDIDEDCEDGDDDWGYYDANGDLVYFCTNDGPDYADMMGGITCIEAPSEIIDPCLDVEVPSPPANATDWSGLDLTCADLTGLDMSGYNLSGVNLSNAVLVEANLSEAILHETNFTGADMTDVALEGVSLRDTICPDGDAMLYTDTLDGICA